MTGRSELSPPVRDRWTSYGTRCGALGRKWHHLCRIPVENLVSEEASHTIKILLKRVRRNCILPKYQCQKTKV